MFWIGFAVGVVVTNIAFVLVLGLSAAARRTEEAMKKEGCDGS